MKHLKELNKFETATIEIVELVVDEKKVYALSVKNADPFNTEYMYFKLDSEINIKDIDSVQRLLPENL